MPNTLAWRFRQRSSPMPDLHKIKIGEGHVFDLNSGASAGHWDVWSGSSPYPAKQERVWDEKHPGPPYQTGGDFAKITVKFPQFQVQGSGDYWTEVYAGGGSARNKYIGGFSDPLWVPALDSLNDADYYSLAWDTIAPSVLPDLQALGAAAYNRLRPKLAKANVGVTLAEARELPRMLQGQSNGFSRKWKAIGGQEVGIRMSPKKLADAFLAIEFGWKPFLKDLGQIFDALDNSAAYIAQIKKDNGQWVRRHRADKTVETEELLYQRTDINGLTPGNGGELYGITRGPYLYTIKLQRYVTVWYEGVFKYYRPAFDDTTWLANAPILGSMHRHLEVLGAYVSPSVIYKATPWSWLIDWFVNVGQLVQKVEDMATDSMVTKYMYLMHHHDLRYELRSIFETSDGRKHDLVWYRECDVKRRLGARNLFSFNPAALTPRQLAILAALGISRTTR